MHILDIFYELIRFNLIFSILCGFWEETTWISSFTSMHRAKGLL